MSTYPRGKEPKCPVKGPDCLGILRDRASRACVECAKKRKAPASIDRRVESEFSLLIEKTSTVRTLDELVRICKVDLAVWKVKSFECSKWDQAAMPRSVGKSRDWTRPSTKPIVTELYRVKATFERKSQGEAAMRLLSQDLLKDIRAEVKRGSKPSRTPRRFVPSDFLFEYTPFDLHMGKLAWDEETVTNYDIDIAEDLFNASLDYLLEQTLKLSDGKLARVLCVFGNDVCHIDSKKAQTTAGTPMDVDTRYIKVYRRICAVHRRAIDILRQVAPVDIKIVPGNHDELTSFHLGELLAARYDSVRHVSVDNSPKLRKYYEFGVNLLGFTHGDKENVKELPLTMAREMPKAWPRCTEREFHVGHLHIKEEWSTRGPRVRDRERLGAVDQDGFAIKGVRVRRLSSLSAHDAWHTGHAYMDRRACDSFLFHRHAGFTSALSFNVDHFTGKALSK